jgi:hypothetical protein
MLENHFAKGPNVTVEKFESNLHLCNQLTGWLPGPTPISSAEELKETLFNGMPHSWSTKFRESGKLDISMQCHTFEFNKESKDLCVIVTPHGNFKHNRLPMCIEQPIP